MSGVVDELKQYMDKLFAGRDPIRRATVTEVISDTAVMVKLNVGVIKVSCSSGYPRRAVGDNVLLINKPGGGWEVLVKLNDPQTGTT